MPAPATKPRVLLQLDPDPQPSVFDAVVAADAGVQHVLRHGGVAPEVVRDLVYGMIFTRGPEDLKHSAIFVGGSRVDAAETLYAEVVRSFFGPMRVSVLFDPSGANTTAAAAVLAAAAHVELKRAEVLVLAATGPVGQRVVRLLAGRGASVRVGSRSADRARAICEQVARQVPGATLSAHATANKAQTAEAAEGARVIVAAGAVGVRLLSWEALGQAAPAVAVDLNAVAPVGLEGIEPTDQAVRHEGLIGYGAIGVGATKMKIHKAAIARLFQRNDQLFDAEEVLALGREIQA